MSEVVVTGGSTLSDSVSFLVAKNAVLKRQVAALPAPSNQLHV